MSSLAQPVPSSPLAIPDFRYFLIARLAASLAATGMVVIIGYQAYDIARTDYGMSIKEASFQLGLLGLVQFLAHVVLTPLAGWVTDRFERRMVARLSDVADLMVALSMGLATAFDVLNLPIIFAIAALHASARVFLGPSMSAIAPNIVPPELLPRAIAMSSMAWQLAAIVGPAISTLLYAASPPQPYWLAAGNLFIAIIALTFVQRVYPPPIDAERHPLKQMVDGLAYVRTNRFLFGAVTLDLFAVLLGGATALLPVYARDILHVGPEGLGLLRGAPGVGATIVALWFSWKPLKDNVGVKMLVAVGIFGLMTIIFGLSQSMWLSLAALAILGGADMLSVYVRNALVQLRTPDAMRGRVSAVSGLAISASNELGEMQSGIAAALLGPVGAVTIGGGAAMAIAGIWAYLFPELRRARTFDPPPPIVLSESVMEEKPA